MCRKNQVMGHVVVLLGWGVCPRLASRLAWVAIEGLRQYPYMRNSGYVQDSRLMCWNRQTAYGGWPCPGSHSRANPLCRHRH